MNPERFPIEIKLHQKSRLMEIAFSDGRGFRLPYELMRIYSPSAEVRGHGPGQEVLQTGKRDVDIVALEPVGNYAVQPRFSDGHDTGIFSWDYLYFLGSQQDELWRKYEARLQEAGVRHGGGYRRPGEGLRQEGRGARHRRPHRHQRGDAAPGPRPPDRRRAGAADLDLRRRVAAVPCRQLRSGQRGLRPAQHDAQ